MMRKEEEDFDTSVEDGEQDQDIQDSMRGSYKRRRKTSSARMVVVAVVLVLIALFAVSKFTKWNVLGVYSWSFKGYQAIFLTNGQVYFGKVSKENTDVLYLNDIYYLQIVPTPGLQSSQSAAASPQGQQQQPQVTLVKLGNELHGPEDIMRIERRQMLFVENLKSDSQVVKAIEEYKKQTGKK